MTWKFSHFQVRLVVQLRKICWSPNHFSEECGEVEQPRNGHVEYDKSSALCRCDTNFQVVGASSVQTCSDGRWSGGQFACKFICIQFIQLNVMRARRHLNVNSCWTGRQSDTQGNQMDYVFILLIISMIMNAIFVAIFLRWSSWNVQNSQSTNRFHTYSYFLVRSWI